jgi:hypothetical protein
MTHEFIKRFTEQKNCLKQRFLAEKTGDQTLYIDQAKLLEPLINSQKETSRIIQDKIISGQETLSNALVPFTRELQKRNDQVEALQSLPFYNIPEIEGVPQSTPKVTPQKEQQQYINVDLDGELLDQTHQENLQDMKLDLPSEVQKKGSYESVIQEIHTKNRQIGQFLRKDSKKTDGEREVYKSQKKTLELYQNKIEGLKGAKQFIVSKKTGEGLCKHKLVKQKRGRGRPKLKPDLIVYSHPGDLVTKLNEYIIAKEAGNTSLDNYINEILDELLEKKCISKDDYDNIFKNVFHKSK